MNVTVSFGTIALAFPFIIASSPYIAQAIKMAGFDAALKGKSYHDLAMRLLTCFVAACVGFGYLLFRQYAVHSVADVLLTLVTLGAYAGIGGSGAMILYSFVNGYLRQSPPAPTPLPVPKVGEPVDGSTNRQPY